jgi:hypothetical protein
MLIRSRISLPFLMAVVITQSALAQSPSGKAAHAAALVPLRAPSQKKSTARAKPPPPPPDAAKLKARCDRADAAACNDLGFAYENGWGAPPDAMLAATVYTRACDGGSAAGCSALGSLYDRGRGVAREAAKGAALHKKACDAGHGRGCIALALHYMSGIGVSRDHTQGAALLARSLPQADRECHAGDASSCTALAWRYLGGHGVTEDDTGATGLSKLGCERGSVRACAFRGVLHAMGKDSTIRDVEAVALCKRASDSGEPEGHTCLGLMTIYQARFGDPEDAFKQAVPSFSLGCDGGDSRACYGLGKLYAAGKSVARDDARAAALFQKACDGGVRQAVRPWPSSTRTARA